MRQLGSARIHQISLALTPTTKWSFFALLIAFPALPNCNFAIRESNDEPVTKLRSSNWLISEVSEGTQKRHVSSKHFCLCKGVEMSIKINQGSSILLPSFFCSSTWTLTLPSFISWSKSQLRPSVDKLPLSQLSLPCNFHRAPKGF